MSNFTLTDVKKRFSELIRRVEMGEEIAITRRGEVVARLVPAADADASERASSGTAGLRASRQGVTLGRLRSNDLIGERR